MVAKGGASLLLDEARESLVTRLLPLATLLTPNLPEAEALTGLRAGRREDLPRLAQRLLELGPRAVLVKGGHYPGDAVTDVLALRDGSVRHFEGPRIHTRSDHGTGCTLASAIATGLGAGLGMADAVARARGYLEGALRAAPGFGGGHGPLHHGWTLSRMPG